MAQAGTGRASWLMRIGNRASRRTLTRARLMAISLPQLWAFVALAGIFIVLGLWLVRPHDFWWHVRAGQWIVENGRLPRTDLFSFTRAGEPWAYQSWVMEVVFYLLLRAGDLPLVIFFHALIITAAYALLLQANRRASGGDLRWAAMATMAAAVVGVDNWNVRPQIISLPLFVCVLYLLQRQASLAPGERDRSGDRSLWWLPPLFAFWANAHGGFVFGLALLGAHLTAQMVSFIRRRGPFPGPLLLITGLSTAATLLTPLGMDMVDYVLGFLRHPVTRNLNVEFAAPTLRTVPGQLFFGFLAVWIASLLAGRYRPKLSESIALLLFGGLALMAKRNTVWFGFVAAPTMAASLRRWAESRGSSKGARVGSPVLNLALTSVVAVLALLSLPWFRPHLPLPEWRRAYVSPETPVEAVAFLRQLPQPRRVFHEASYGSYMIWASPEVPVFIDTRLELYPPAQWSDYIALSQARYDWEAILKQYGVDTLLLRRETQGPLIEAATVAPGWERCYQDEQAVIFQRREGS